MATTDTHFLDLNIDIINRIFDQLDLMTIRALASTCSLLRRAYEAYKTDFPGTYERKVTLRIIEEKQERVRMLADKSSDSYDSYDDLDNYCDLDRYVEDQFDRFSYGSNYDPDMDDLINGEDHSNAE